MIDETNNRITTREFYDELKEMRQEQADMERRILAKIDSIRTCKVEEHQAIYAEIADVRVKSNRIDGVISAALILGNSIAIAFGIRQQ